MLNATMPRPAHNIPPPIPITVGDKSQRAFSVVHRIADHYERRGIIAKSILWGALVTVVGFTLDALVHLLPWAWADQHLLENVVEGVFFSLLVCVVLSAREQRLRRRFREVGYLNHHIRNSLAIIEMAEGYVGEATERLQMVKDASTRIRRCIEKISREEDVEISDRFPEEP